jgi:hypothetical protein
MKPEKVCPCFHAVLFARSPVKMISKEPPGRAALWLLCPEVSSEDPPVCKLLSGRVRSVSHAEAMLALRASSARQSRMSLKGMGLCEVCSLPQALAYS